MTQGWIVSKHRYVVHLTPETAFRELDRLTAKTGKRFRVMRIKNYEVQRPTQEPNNGDDSAQLQHGPTDRETRADLIAGDQHNAGGPA